ncbi:MAG: LysM peptidoglycan-binding domain-containing protein [Gammaproteobacteria bacterium]
MFYARKPLIRSACLIVAAAASFVTLSSGLAQERDSKLELAAVGQPAASPVLNPRHPETYVVKRGDTLWGIASVFLRDPWLWPEIWQVNPQIENPHLIFPGDTLSLAYRGDGRPVIQVTERGGPQPATGSGGFEKLSPRVRSQPLEDAIQTIPYDTLRSFLSRPRVLQKRDLDHLPYVVAQRDGLMASVGRDIYVRRAEGPVGTVYNVVDLGQKLVDPDTRDTVGYLGIHVGQGRVDRAGDPATVHLLDTEREAVNGNYLVAEEDVVPANFLPHSPAKQVDGRIMAVLSGVSLIGQYNVVVLNRGANDGLDPGTVLRVYQAGKTIRDTHAHGAFNKKVDLPDEPAGTMMVFRTSDRISYALIMEATTAIAVLDKVRNP